MSTVALRNISRAPLWASHRNISIEKAGHRDQPFVSLTPHA
jgi:hypothetical protein